MVTSTAMSKQPRTPQTHSLELEISIARQVIEEGTSLGASARDGPGAQQYSQIVRQGREGKLGDYRAPAFNVASGRPHGEIRRLERALLRVTQERDF